MQAVIGTRLASNTLTWLRLPVAFAAMDQDRRFKRLVYAYPLAALYVLAYELIQEYGPPLEIRPFGHEVPPGATEQTGTIDIGLHCIWPDLEVIVLVEHWSRARDVDFVRVNRYVADLHHKFREVGLVYPVSVVTDPAGFALESSFKTAVGQHPVLEFHCRVVCTDAGFVARWRWEANRVAAALCLLGPLPADAGSRVDAVFHSFTMALAAPGDLKDFVWYIPLLEDWCNLDDVERSELQQRIEEDPKMTSVVEMFQAKGEAKGEAKGNAKGRVEGSVLLIQQMVAGGVITHAQGLEQLRQLAAKGLLDETAAKLALERLNGDTPEQA